MKIRPFLLSATVSLALLSAPAFAGVETEEASKPAPIAKPQAASKKIDNILAAEWKAEGIEPNAPISDEVFLRRVYLDVVGRIPSYQEATEFLDSKTTDKRAALIDELLASEGYVNHFYNYWADILRINTAQPASQNITPFYIQWVRDALTENMPYDKFVYSLLTAEGQAWENGAIGYYYRDRGMALDNMANTVRIFLGTRLECAQCHDHPFDMWTQTDFYHMAAYTYGINSNSSPYGAASAAQRLVQKDKKMGNERKRELRSALTEITRQVRNNNTVSYRDSLPKLPHDYGYDDAKPNEKIVPRTIFGADPQNVKPEERVRTYAEWMTSSDNPLFTKVIANRLWKKLMGVGLYEPVDEFTEMSESSNPELMEFLEQQMNASGYDVKAYLRLILNSQVYQRASTDHDIVAGESYHFPGPKLRRMSAEQIWDSTVVLVNATPEMPEWKREQQFALRMAEQKAMIEALENSKEKDLVAAAAKVAKVQADLQKEDEKLRKQIEVAKAAGDKKKASALSKEVGKMRSKLRAEVVELVYHPVMENAKPEPVEMNLPTGKSIAVSPMMMDGNGSSSSVLRKLQAAAEKKLIADEMTAMGMKEPAAKKSYSAYRAKSLRMLRAAHVGSPAPPGHFLREFGQSDRDTIENANYDASVPQALHLLNGSTFGMVSSSQSVLSRNVHAAKTPEEKIDTIFLSLLTRRATEKERQILLSHAKERGKSLYADTAYALMNGQEFWFQQ